MKRGLLIFFIFALLSAGIAAADDGESYFIDRAHSYITLTVESGGWFPIKGRFRNFSGTFFYNKKRGGLLGGAMKIKSNSLKTGNHRDDSIFWSKNFLSVARFPEMELKVKSLKPITNDKYKLLVDITLKNKTVQNEFTATFVGEGRDRCNFKRVGFYAEGSLSRKSLGLDKERLYGNLFAGLDDKVKVTIDISGAQLSARQSKYKCGNTEASRRLM